MSDSPAPAASSPIPDDDPRRALAVVPAPDTDDLRHIAIAGGIYTILLTGQDTDGRFCLVEMRVPPGGGPPPHRHDFEETFRVLEGEVEFTFRGETVRAGTGATVNVPANAPHSFRNVSGASARLLCICAPAGQEELFLALADPVERVDSPPPPLTDEQRAERGAKARALAGQYRSEFI